MQSLTLAGAIPILINLLVLGLLVYGIYWLFEILEIPEKFNMLL
jgi:hypothetical protein